jgi:DUF1680 family protein
MIRIPKASYVSWFIFEQASGHTIALKAPKWSAAQELYINGQRVQSQRSFGLRTQHLFPIGEDLFELEVDTEAPGLIRAQLSKNDLREATVHLESRKSEAPAWLALVLAFVLAQVVQPFTDTITSEYGWTGWSHSFVAFSLFFVLGCALSIAFILKNQGELSLKST